MIAAHGLMLHRLHAAGSRPEGQGSLSSAEFEGLVISLGVERFLPPEEWISRSVSGRLSPGDLCLTFDDGLRCQYDVALPVLERLGLRAFWFVYSSVFRGEARRGEIASYLISTEYPDIAAFNRDFIPLCGDEAVLWLEEPAFQDFAGGLRRAAPSYSDDDLRYRFVRNRLAKSGRFAGVIDELVRRRGLAVEEISRRLWLTDHELKRLSSRGHEIGLHSWDHPFRFEELPGSEQERQYRINRDHIAETCGRAPTSMSHPLNSYNQTTLRILASLGITCGFRADMHLPPGHGALNPHPLELARLDPAAMPRPLFA